MMILRFTLSRLGVSVLVLFVVSAITFLLISLSPGNAASTILGAYATPARVAALSKQLHLSEPLPQQYWSWVTAALHGDFGQSLLTGQPVADSISARLEPTISLVLLTVLVTAVLGTVLGVVSALRGGVVARAVDAVGLLGFAVPGFIVGLVLILVFAVRIRLFPFGGYTPLSEGIGAWAAGMVLPVAALSIGGIGFLSKQVRASMLDALNSDFIRTMTANGFSRRSIVYKHTLRSAAIPALAMLGIQVVGLLSGSVLIEQVFGVPGVGGLAVQATVQKDLPVVETVAVVFTLLVVVMNLVLDVLYVLVNPKVRVR